MVLTVVATLLAGRILKNPLGKMFAFDYKVTGTWADPKVDKVQQEQTQALPPAMDR